VASHLAGVEVDNGSVYRACALAAKSVMWNVAREAV
jgi:hypothetical protein